MPWVAKKDMPNARWQGVAVEIDGKIYVCGGTISVTGYTGANEMYDPVTDNWVNKTADSVRGGQASSVVEGKMYVVGGTDGTNDLKTSKVYNPQANTWLNLTSAPSTIKGVPAVGCNGLVYVFGGSVGNKTTYCYTPTTDKWTSLSTAPFDPHGATVACVKNQIYVFVADNTYCYDSQKDSWTKLRSMPTPRKNMSNSSAVVGNKIVVAGGISISDSKLTNIVEAYDTVTDTWETLPSLPVALQYPMCVAVGNKAYVIGGNDGTVGVGQKTVYELAVNLPPTLTLMSPTDNLSLTEGSPLFVKGSATDPDNGDVVTVRYKINNGPAQATASGVSDGSTPISFAKDLTYKYKRVYLGTTDITGADLAENTDHILTVWAEDDKGGKSAEVTRKFRVIWNRPPIISGSDGDLGTMEAPPEVTYSVSDPESNPFTVTEKINGAVIRTFAGVAGRQEKITVPVDKWIELEPGVQHTLIIEATDDQGMKSTRKYTFMRFVNAIYFDEMDYATLDSATKTFFTTDVAAKRLLLTPVWDLPPGVNLIVEATNNAYDAVPTWEDATIPVKLNRAYIFTNTTKTAAKWGINFRFKIEKGTAIGPVYFKGIGGAFG